MGSEFQERANLSTPTTGIVVGTVAMIDNDEQNHRNVLLDRMLEGRHGGDRSKRPRETVMTTATLIASPLAPLRRILPGLLLASR